MHGIIDTNVVIVLYTFVPPSILNVWSERVQEGGIISQDKTQLSDDDSSYLYIFLLLFYICLFCVCVRPTAENTEQNNVCVRDFRDTVSKVFLKG